MDTFQIHINEKPGVNFNLNASIPTISLKISYLYFIGQFDLCSSSKKWLKINPTI